MDFAFSEEQDEFRETLRRFFEEKAPSAEVRRMMESPEGFDRSLWKQMGEELGLQGVHLPEACGGQGFGFLELGIVLEEMGRVLLPSPYFGTVVLAAGAIRNAGTEEQQKQLLPGLAGGEVASLAFLEETGLWGPEGITLEAHPDGAGVRLSGTKSFVIEGECADRLVVAARLPGTSGGAGVTLCVLDAGSSGVSLSPLPAMDPTRRQARLELDGATATPLGEPGCAGPALERTLHQAALALATEMVGGAQRCLDLSVDYAKQRVQFARPIGAFQAIKHKASEMLLQLELARSAAYWALWVADEGRDDLPEAAHLSKAFCGDAYLHAAAECIQIHGGMGFTWEHDAHLYYKRAKGSDVLFGDATHHRAQLAGQLGF